MFRTKSCRAAHYSLRRRDLDDELSYCFASSEILLSLLHTLSGKGVLSMDADLQVAIGDEPEELRAIAATLLGRVDVVAQPVREECEYHRLELCGVL